MLTNPNNEIPRPNRFIKPPAKKIPAAAVAVVPGNSTATLPKLEIPEIVKKSTLRGLLLPDLPEDPHRPCMVFNIKGHNIAFYRSSKGTSNKIEGNWYPFFGITRKFWIIKGETSISEIGYGIPEIAQIQRELNQAFQGQGARDVIKILLIHNQKKLAPALEISKYCYGKEMFDEINQQDGSSDKHIKDILEKLR